jgi:ribonucleoside-triphosphate reductase
MNECCLNFLRKDIVDQEGRDFAVEVLDYMREKLRSFQEESGNIYNLEATPAEGTSYRLAMHDKKKFPEIVTSGSADVPYYTNSSQLPVDYTSDLFEALEHQDDLQTRYTGGTVFHGFVGERISDWKTAAELVRRITNRYRMPYFTITPTFSICPIHGYISGEHSYCPYDHTQQELDTYGEEVC